MEPGALMAYALAARGKAYAPYSGFSVGAALLCTDGEIICGGNVENAAYAPGLCAERVALGFAAGQGKRAFLALAVAGSGSAPCPPCGLCRQTLREFCGDDFPIYFAGADVPDAIIQTTLGALLPMSFGPEHLKGGGNS